MSCAEEGHRNECSDGRGPDEADLGIRISVSCPSDNRMLPPHFLPAAPENQRKLRSAEMIPSPTFPGCL